MNVSANVQTGSVRTKVADLATPSPRGASAGTPRDAGPRDRAKTPLAASAAAGDTGSRCSPDPCQHTDRYRLVTPFSLRL